MTHPVETSPPVTVVTGANSGIGRATAVHLASHGHIVYGTVRAEAKASKLLAMAGDAGVEVRLVELDVADDDSVRAGLGRVLDEAGRVDHLVNNAGVGGNAVTEECPTSLYSEVFNVNVNGAVRCHEDALTIPLKWRKPRRVFVNSMSDLFYGTEQDRAHCERHGVPFEPVPFEFIDRVFAVMALCPRHTFQILTKRPERMAEYFADVERSGRAKFGEDVRVVPRPNVWLGVSVENQEQAERLKQI